MNIADMISLSSEILPSRLGWALVDSTSPGWISPDVRFCPATFPPRLAILAGWLFDGWAVLRESECGRRFWNLGESDWLFERFPPLVTLLAICWAAGLAG